MSDQEFTTPVPTPLESFEPSVPTSLESFEPSVRHTTEPELEPVENDAPEPSAKAVKALISKSAARKIIDKYIEISTAPKPQVQALASALGVKSDAADIASIVSTASRNPLIALSELETVTSASSPFEAVVAAFALERDGAKRVWALLTQLGRASGNLPVKESIAAARIAAAASELADADRTDLEIIRALGRK